MKDKEKDNLVRLIEKLGDDLGDLSKLSESIFKTVKKNFGVSNNTLGIWRLFITLPRLEEYYSKFHTNIFIELNKSEEELNVK